MNHCVNKRGSGQGPCRPNPGSPLGRKGFTLIEILVAIFLFSLIMATLYTSFNTVFSSVAPLEKSSESYAMAKNAFSIMTADLMAAYISLPPYWKKPDFDEAEPDRHLLKGEMMTLATEPFHRLRFSTMNHISFNEVRGKGVSEIVYYVTQNPEGGFVLRRFDQLYPHKEFEESGLDPVICESLRSFEVRYFDEEGEEQEVWDSESDTYGYATPASVFIRIAVGGNERDAIFETRVTLPLCRKKS